MTGVWYIGCRNQIPRVSDEDLRIIPPSYILFDLFPLCLPILTVILDDTYLKN